MTAAAFRWSLAGLVAVAASGAGLDVMEVDAAQYAAMSRDMLAQDDWLKLYHRGRDYLDKPPLLFWLSALSFKLFGVYNWSYKLPSILFAFLGVFSTYRFALLFHGAAIARRAAVMFGASAAFLLMTNDVRCDTILTGSVVTAIWAGASWIQQRRWWQLLASAAAVAAGMLAKGPMGAVAPVAALAAHLAMGGHWRALRDPRWLAVPLLVAVALIPMCIGLYEQHGAHGIRFYFWEQSFGRITGENRWKDDSTALFFTHELLWQALPWTLFVITGLGQQVIAAFRRQPLPEHAALGGSMLVFAALSLSQFKLPHYLYVIMPLLAVLGAIGWEHAAARWARYGQIAVVALLAVALIALTAWCFPSHWWPIIPLALAPGVVLLWRGLAAQRRDRLFTGTVWVWLVAGLALNALIYPEVLGYQANARAGRWAKEQRLDANRFYVLNAGGTALDFYAGFTPGGLASAEQAAEVVEPGFAIYTDTQGLAALADRGLAPSRVMEFEDYRVQLLSLDFILPWTRAESTSRRYVVVY